jgi:hypothetical protein
MGQGVSIHDSVRKENIHHALFKPLPNLFDDLVIHRSMPQAGEGKALFLEKSMVQVQRGRSHAPYLFRKFGNGADVLLSLSRRNPHKAQTILQPDEPHQFLKEGDSLDGHVITVQVMAIPDVSPSHQDPVCPALKSLQHMVRRNSGRAHDPDGPEVGGVLKPAHSCQIRRTVSTPVAEKGEDSGFKRSLVHG